MVVLDQVLSQLSCVFDDLFADAVQDECLLQKCVATVFFVGKDALQTGNGPCRFSLRSERSRILQCFLDLSQRVSHPVSLVNVSNYLCLVLIDHRLPICPSLVAQHLFVLHIDMAALHGLPLAPFDIAAECLAVILGDGSIQGDQELTLRINGVDIVFLEDHRDAQAPELPCVLDRVHGVAGEPGDRLRQDHIDLSLPAHPDHPQEVLAFAGGGSCLALVRKHLDQGPVGFPADFFREVFHLVLIAGELLFTVGRYPAVGSHPQIFPLVQLLWASLRRRYDDDFWRSRCHP